MHVCTCVCMCVRARACVFPRVCFRVCVQSNDSHLLPMDLIFLEADTLRTQSALPTSIMNESPQRVKKVEKSTPLHSIFTLCMIINVHRYCGR